MSAAVTSSLQLPSQKCTNKSIDNRLWWPDHIQRDPALGKQGYYQYRYALGHDLLGHPSSGRFHLIIPGNQKTEFRNPGLNSRPLLPFNQPGFELEVL